MQISDKTQKYIRLAAIFKDKLGKLVQSGSFLDYLWAKMMQMVVIC